MQVGQAMTREEMIDRAIVNLGLWPRTLRDIDRTGNVYVWVRTFVVSEFRRIAAREAKT